jgi:hypothetical protein
MRKCLLLALLIISAGIAKGSEISVVAYEVGGQILTNDIIIEGEIVNGDYEKFLSACYFSFRCEPSGPHDVSVFSRGGNALEGMKIGRLIRKLRLSTMTPSGPSDGLDPDNDCGLEYGFWGLPKDRRNCNCASTGFLIWFGGVERHCRILGIHRAFVDHELLKTMSEEDAVKYTRLVNEKVEGYLSEMGATTELIEYIKSIPSNEIQYILPTYYKKQLEGFIPEYQEWVLSKCGDTHAVDMEIKAIELAYPSKTERDVKNIPPEVMKKYGILQDKRGEVGRCQSSIGKKIRADAFNKYFDVAVNEVKPMFMSKEKYFASFNTKVYSKFLYNFKNGKFVPINKASVSTTENGLLLYKAGKVSNE